MQEIGISILYVFLFLYFIKKWSFFNCPSINRKYFYSIFILKVLAGFTLYIIYSQYYTNRSTADVFRYFDDSTIMISALQHNIKDFFRMLFGIDDNIQRIQDYYYELMNSWVRRDKSTLYNDNRLLIRFNAALHLFSWGNYHIHTIIFCFLGFIGETALYKFFRKATNVHPYLILIGVYLLPSVMLWTSGILKEPLLFMFLGIVLYCSFLIIYENKKSLKYFILIATALPFLFFLKMYVFLIMVPWLIAYYISTKKDPIYTFGITASLLVLIVLCLHWFTEQYDILQLITYKRNGFIALAKDVNAGSLMNMDKINATIASFLYHIPEALFVTLLKPFPWNFNNPLVFAASIENILLLLFLIYCVSHLKYFKSEIESLILGKIVYPFKQLIRKNKYSRKEYSTVKINQTNLGFVLFCFGYAFTTLIIIGLTTPVLGASVRYEVPVMPFLVMLGGMILTVKCAKKNPPRT
ncbi:MAG: hypothetical protein ABEH43_02430 [Flavobacteriales bacterium]